VRDRGRDGAGVFSGGKPDSLLSSGVRAPTNKLDLTYQQSCVLTIVGLTDRSILSTEAIGGDRRRGKKLLGS
jgi:hypothetical protein